MNLEALLKRGEGKTLEFKRDLSSSRNILKTLTAFANTAGGVLLIGIDDETRTVLGIDQPLDEEERLCNLVGDGIEPRLLPNIELIAWKDKTLLAVEVFPSSLRPHWLKKHGPDAVFVRLGSTNRQADADLIAELRRTALGQSFDEQPLPDFGTEVIDREAASALFKDQRKISEKDLETLRIVTRLEKRRVPTAGMCGVFR